MRQLLKRSFLLVGAFFLLPFPVQGQVLKEHTRYVLRPGDTLLLQYRLTPDLDQTVSIQPDGFVSLNLLGDVPVTGLTVEQAHDLIVSKAGSRLNKPELNLIL